MVDSETYELRDLLQIVVDEDSFLIFLQALSTDFVKRNKRAESGTLNPSSSYNGEWENITIDSFFESAAAWGVDSRGMGGYSIPDNPWRRCAEILFAGTIYE